jgi:predicted alpha-1,2-mannosidase
MKRLLKFAAYTLLLLLAVPVLGLLGMWATYKNVVRHTPGALAVPESPGVRGIEVNPFIGTGGVPWMCGHDTPAATMPFGMVRLGPDTQSLFVDERCLNRSGYFYGDPEIIGFSHTRLIGADAKEGGVFRVFPTTEARVEAQRKPERATPFSHAEETAFPGYYAVRLPKEGVLAEMSSTPRVGVHRYTFDDSNPHILLHVSSILGGNSSDARVRVLPDAREVEGQNTIRGSFSGRYDGLTVYFAARFSQPFQSVGTWTGAQFTPDTLTAQGDEIGADFGFTVSPGTPLELRLAISYVSIENARLNLEAEAAAISFENIVASARDAWEDKLNLITVKGGTAREQRIFTSALYRSLQMPTTFSDVNGDYRGFDKELHKAGGFVYYTDFSLWDSFRTIHPLYNLIARKEQRDMMVSLVEMLKAGGALPRWPSGCGYTNCMFGTPADVAVSEAYLKGVRDFDIEAAYASMRQLALEGKPAWTKFAGREGLEWYLQYNYLPSEKMSDAVAATLEYAWCDTALANLATELGRTEDAAAFATHSKSYKNLWNPASTFFEPRDSSGAFSTRIKPTLLSYVDFDREFTDDYVEGSAMQWRFAVPYDAEGLVALFPSKEEFVSELEAFFENSTQGVGKWNPGGWYWHGNEPYIHSAYLFNAAGRPDLTQKWVRWIMERKYDDTYYGLDGNDDGGTLSAWYVLSAMGFYPLAGTTTYFLGSPLFEHIEINLGGDTRLTVVAENNSPENVYVQRVSLNGVPLTGTSFTHEQIAEGGKLHFVMGPEPAK